MNTLLVVFTFQVHSTTPILVFFTFLLQNTDIICACIHISISASHKTQKYDKQVTRRETWNEIQSRSSSVIQESHGQGSKTMKQGGL